MSLDTSNSVLLPLGLLALTIFGAIVVLAYKRYCSRRLGYRSATYWDVRYTQTGEAADEAQRRFDWYLLDEAVDLVMRVVPREWHDRAVLEIGCGTSELSTRLAERGFSKLVASDFSAVCIRQLTEAQNRRQPGTRVSYVCMDVRKMTFPTGGFYVVLDKATLDSIAYTDHPRGERADVEARQNAEAAMDEVVRVLRVGGLFVSVSNKNEAKWKQLWLRPQFEYQQRVKREVKMGGQLINFYIHVVRRIQ